MRNEKKFKKEGEVAADDSDNYVAVAMCERRVRKKPKR